MNVLHEFSYDVQRRMTQLELEQQGNSVTRQLWIVAARLHVNCSCYLPFSPPIVREIGSNGAFPYLQL